MLRRSRILWLFCCGAATVVGCSSESVPPAGQPAGDDAQDRVPKVRVYRLDGFYYDKLSQQDEDEPLEPPKNGFRSWPILESSLIGDPRLAEELEQAIDAPSNFGGAGAACFWPGMGISIGAGSERIDAVICLKCNWLYLYAPKKDVNQLALSDQGKETFARLYARLFPGQPELPRSE